MHVASWIWVLIPITAIVCGILAGIANRWIRLKERLAVIERITVEKENSLAREIEQLRDR